MAKEENLGQRLKRLRLEKGFSCKELAKLIGVSDSTYREWEYGRSIRGEPYLELSKAFDISVHELLTGQSLSLSETYEHIEIIEKHFIRLKEELRKL